MKNLAKILVLIALSFAASNALAASQVQKEQPPDQHVSIIAGKKIHDFSGFKTTVINGLHNKIIENSEVVLSASSDVPYKFTNGQIANADHVNSNFDHLSSADSSLLSVVDALSSKILNLESSDQEKDLIIQQLIDQNMLQNQRVTELTQTVSQQQIEISAQSQTLVDKSEKLAQLESSVALLTSGSHSGDGIPRLSEYFSVQDIRGTPTVVINGADLNVLNANIIIGDNAPNAWDKKFCVESPGFSEADCLQQNLTYDRNITTGINNLVISPSSGSHSYTGEGGFIAGNSNVITSSGIVTGANNILTHSGKDGAILGGSSNVNSGSRASIISGNSIHITSGSDYSGSLGGSSNVIKNSRGAASAGGQSNVIEESDYAITAAGRRNRIFNGNRGGTFAGQDNQVNESHSSVISGSDGQANGDFCSVIAGRFNKCNGDWSVSSAGRENKSDGRYSNTTGFNTTATGDASFTCGHSSYAPLDASFVCEFN